MNTQSDPREMTLAATQIGTHAGYMPGFGNDFETEALEGALPRGMRQERRSSRKLAHVLVVETVVVGGERSRAAPKKD
ncbi:MAG: homogentisate 1,2-dioxygenase, partial [Pseudomonadota bacterium]